VVGDDIENEWKDWREKILRQLELATTGVLGFG
jgi:hypothetical protein